MLRILCNLGSHIDTYEVLWLGLISRIPQENISEGFAFGFRRNWKSTIRFSINGATWIPNSWMIILWGGTGLQVASNEKLIVLRL